LTFKGIFWYTHKQQHLTHSLVFLFAPCFAGAKKKGIFFLEFFVSSTPFFFCVFFHLLRENVFSFEPTKKVTCEKKEIGVGFVFMVLCSSFAFSS